jgi:Amt family ammonium transporter
MPGNECETCLEVNVMGRVKMVILIVTLVVLMPGLALAEDVGTMGTDSGTTAWMLTSTALVLLMVPGLAMFYGGLVRTKNVLGTMMHSFAAMGIIGVLWAVCGYSMSFGPNVLGGWCGWSWDYFFLKGIDTSITNGIPEYVFAMFQGKFAIITPALIAGAFAERVKFKTYCLFITLWGLLVYNPLCHWVWYADGSDMGFLYRMGTIDFAGGTVVHISSGVSALVLALFLKPREGYPKTAMHPNNLSMTLIGAGLLWVGWFGFNAGSAVASDLKTAQALTVTQIAAATGAVAWMLIEMVHQGKATSLGIASGILAGLVAITPAAGDVLPYGAIILGALAALICYSAIQFKNRIGYDDTLDVFGIHGMGGITGALMLVFFMRNTSAGIVSQFMTQFTAVLIAIVYAAIVTIILAVFLEKTIGLRADGEEELSGLDYSQHAERAYAMSNVD